MTIPLSAEARMLLLSAGPPSNDAALRELARGAVDWSRLERLAESERALPPFWHRLRAASGTVPREAEPLARSSLVAEFRFHLVERRLADALAALAAAGIEPLLLKGAALAWDVYAGLAHRPMGDADLLVEPGEVVRASDALRSAGFVEGADVEGGSAYRTHHHQPPLDDRRGSGLTIELHTELFSPGHPFAFGAATVRSRARRALVLRTPVLLPDRTDLLLHASLHFAWSHMMRSGAWRCLRDVNALASAAEIDWGRFVSAARAANAATCCYWTLRLARTLAGVAQARSAERALHPGTPEAALSRLERHYATNLLPEEAPRNASFRLDALLWTLGTRPGANRHGLARPWRHSAEFPRRSGDDGDAQAARGNRLGRAARTAWYGARVVLGR